MPYRKGYNLLPGLEKLKLPIFEVNERERFISLKKEEILKQECFSIQRWNLTYTILFVIL